MKAPVKKSFRDKHDKNKKLYRSAGPDRPADVFEGDEKRVKELQKKGYLGTEGTEESGQPAELTHVGGGYYELPDGTKVKGKQEAETRLRDLS
ncbi:hypothetical protein [Alkalicoccus luteus]|uniref:hypothetical protein n=1 Tax=Alkalicoccus luteus TaxID=1237094 RepID=UPI001FE31EC4|nr:hypothetical protein [Alkalicoccus luteus]